jgi:hypothetical protein
LEAIRQVRRGIELAATDMNGARRGLAERDNAWIEAMDESAKGKEIKGTGGGNAESTIL